MLRIVRPARRLLAQAAAGLTVAGLGIAWLTPAAQAAGPGRPAIDHVARGSLLSPAIRVNTLNWSGDAGFGSRRPTWYKDGSGVVHLQGAVKQTSDAGSGANVIGTLPPAARPKHNVYTIVHTFGGTFADLDITANGEIILINPDSFFATDYSFVSLEGISYRPSGKTFPINLNTTNFSGDAGFGSRPPGWYIDRSGIVHLQGAVTETDTFGNYDFIGTLPPAARPKHNVYTIVHTFDGTYADLEIASNGTLNLIDSRIVNYTFISLESITYRPSGKVSPVPLNTLNWFGDAGFGSRAPAWYTDKYGIVHLQGAVTQISNSGNSANVIGTLPPAARPTHNVYTIVHTFDGTYADLEIASNGKLILINPRPPAVTDYAFVSLESISYRRR
jgi:phosphatidylethanolamine-binding protein (PEBP) family uncharacterized protein